jgi:hypothetical protein
MPSTYANHENAFLSHSLERLNKARVSRNHTLGQRNPFVSVNYVIRRTLNIPNNEKHNQNELQV